MRNLFILIFKYHFFLLFLLFESVSSYLIIENNDFQKTAYINSANSVAAQIYNLINDITEYVRLKETNQKLAAENALLHSRLPEECREDLHNILVTDSVYHQQYIYLSGKVINNSVNKRNNFLTLRIGSLDGVRPEMGVISATGIAGIVKDVSEHYCTVISVLNKDFHTSAKLKTSSYFGNLSWEGGNPYEVTVTNMPKHLKLQVGDTLVTSTHSGIFPEGINIGTIESFEVKPGDNFYTLTLRLSTDFHNLDYVYVIHDLLKQERKKIAAKYHD